jgi:hypothetical protein
MLVVLGILLPSYHAFGLTAAVEHTSEHHANVAKSTPPTR